LKKSPHTIEIGFKLKVDHHEELYKSWKHMSWTWQLKDNNLCTTI
jgi:hypothetical protein